VLLNALECFEYKGLDAEEAVFNSLAAVLREEVGA